MARPRIMSVRFWSRTLLIVPLVAGGLLAQTAAGQDGAPALDALDSRKGAPATDTLLLSSIAKDLGLSLLASPDQVRVPLAPGDWSLLKGVRPYAMLSPSTLKPITGAEPTLSGPLREPTEDSWRGLGVGAGLQWRLSDRVDLFGQYEFMSLPGANAPSGSPIMRREVESPGLKAGFSIHF